MFSRKGFELGVQIRLVGSRSCNIVDVLLKIGPQLSSTFSARAWNLVFWFNSHHAVNAYSLQ